MYKFRRSTGIILVLITVALIFYFITRNYFLRMVFENQKQKLKSDYNAIVSSDEITFTGFAGIMIKNLVVVPEKQDTLLIIDSLYARPSLFHLLFGKIRLKEAVIKNVSLSLVCLDSICNYKSFINRGKRDPGMKHAKKNYSDFLDALVSKAFNLAPQKAELKNINIRYVNESSEERVMIPSFVSSDQLIEGLLFTLPGKAQWNLTGKFSQRRRTFDIKIFPDTSNHSNLPFLPAACRFDSLHFMLNDYSHSGDETRLSGSISTDHFILQHRKVSDQPVGISHADFDFNFLVRKNSLLLDSTSIVALNKMKIHPSIEYINDGKKQYELKFGIDKLPANDFFASLPSGMFDEIDGVEADGNLEYSVYFKIDSSHPDSLIFNSTMKKEKFRLKNAGRENLLKMNGEFLYSVYENDRYIRSFMVGPSNPGFTPIEQVSPYFKNAVMTSEDGSFFYHNGFNEDAFRKSIAANYKAGKFVRGGSTITMQLVKNVFLTHHKTISRKAEEALIVWLIESNHLSNKDRMFEVYLNIIELGPGIYGIGEASHFYFNKKPGELNLAESVFLASLLPRPKWFKYSFDEHGNLKPYFADYYRVVANFLLKKNLISQMEYDQLQPHVELKGIARDLVMSADSIPQLNEEQDEQ